MSVLNVYATGPEGEEDIRIQIILMATSINTVTQSHGAPVNQSHGAPVTQSHGDSFNSGILAAQIRPTRHS